MDILFSSLFAGLLIGMILALVALGLTIIFGVMDIVNFAHGEFLMIGMYTGLLTAQGLGIDPLFTLPAAALVGFLLGIVCYFGFIKFVLRGPMVAQLLGTFGLMLLLRNLALLIFGSEDRAVHTGIMQSIRHVHDRMGITVILIEHVMELVMKVSHKLIVLDYGQKIAEGDPDTISRDPLVIKAYLGERYAEAHG